MTLFVEKDIRQTLPFGHYFWGGMYKTYQRAEESLINSFDNGEIGASDLRTAKIIKFNGAYYIALADYNMNPRM